MVLVALELDDGVDNVFENLRTGQRALFVDVSDDDDGNAARLCKAQQGGSALAHLGDAAGRRVDLFGGNGLDGVDDHELWLHVAYVGKDGLERCLAEDEGLS